MSQRIAGAELTQIAIVSEAPVKTRVDRNFGLPSGLYAATVGLYLAFIGLMGLLFLNPELAIPMVIFAGFVIIAFGVCAVWATMAPENDSSPLTWGQFSSRGIQTLSGPLTSGEATVQVLILPVLIMFWGLSIAVIVALN